MSQAGKNDGVTLNNDYHTLFVTTLDEETKVIKPKRRQFRLYIDSFSENKNGLHKIYHELSKADADDEICLEISSNGGLVDELLTLYNIVTNRFKGRSTSILNNHGYSAGAMAFCMCSERIAYEYSELMFHDYSSVFYGKGGEIETRAVHYSKHLREFFESILVVQKFLSQDEFARMLIGQDFWFGTLEMCKRGICTHVIKEGEKMTAEAYLAFKRGDVVVAAPEAAAETEAAETTEEPLADVAPPPADVA
jgi:ATP-dependent protease ClpP protease subunit